MMDKTLLLDRDYSIVIARTTTDDVNKPPRFADRWADAEAAILQLAQACEEHDPDGITVYVSCCSTQDPTCFKKYEHVTSTSLNSVIQGNYPPLQINLQHVLQAVLDHYFDRKAAGTTKPNGEIILVLLDGEPHDRMAVAAAIKVATQKMERDKELGIGFVQVGEDVIAAGFLKALDDHLEQVGAKFDIVNTVSLDTIEPDSLTEFLLSTLYD